MYISATLFIMCGLPGAGETTLAKRIETSLPVFRMSADNWMTALSINLHAEQQRADIEALQRQLTKRLLSLGQSVVIEWAAWGTWERDLFRTEARELNARVELYYVAAPVAESFARIQKRNMEDPLVKWEDVLGWSKMFETPTDTEMTLYDTHFFTV